MIGFWVPVLRTSAWGRRGDPALTHGATDCRPFGPPEAGGGCTAGGLRTPATEDTEGTVNTVGRAVRRAAVCSLGPALELAVRMLKRHSVLSVVGYHQGGPRSVDFQMLNWKAADVINAHEKRTDFKMDCLLIGLALAAAGRLELGSLITHRYPLEEADRAFADYESKPDGYIKGLILP